MTSSDRNSRTQQQAEELSAAAIRAYTGDERLHFRARRLHRDHRALPMHAAHLQPIAERDAFTLLRGAADGMALRVRHSDADLHRALSPTDAIARMVFELLEQFRVESLVPTRFPGMRRNLRHRFDAWTRAFAGSGLTENPIGMLLFTVAQICRLRVTNEAILEDVECMMESTRAALAPRTGHALAGLKRERLDQARYAVHAQTIATVVGEMVEAAEQDPRNQAASALDDEARDKALARFGLLIDFDADAGDGIARLDGRRDDAGGADPMRYRVFTTEFDREVPVEALARSQQLGELRERLDRVIAAQGVNLPRLARALRMRLSVPVSRDWNDAEEEGLVDGRRLARVVSSPTERRLFRQERERTRTDCLVSFLIDCSGSMKALAEPVAMLVDVFARALELAGADVEVLGFTTTFWNGGRVLDAWNRAGRPPAPGRLNGVCHMIFKAAETPWRRARPAIAALLKPDIFREGVDGEALRWACQRARSHPRPRRIVVVVSDGSPMDSATARVNGNAYLDEHLREIVAAETATGGVEIAAIGVGLDLSPFYRHNLPIDATRSFGSEMFAQVLELIASRHGRELSHKPPSRSGSAREADPA